MAFEQLPANRKAKGVGASIRAVVARDALAKIYPKSRAAFAAAKMLASGPTQSWAVGPEDARADSRTEAVGEPADGGEVAMQEESGQSVSEQRAALLRSMQAPSDALTLHEKPVQEDDALPRRKRLCPNWRALQSASTWTEPVLIDHDTCDVVLEDDADVMEEESMKAAAEFGEPCTPSRSPVQTYGAAVDEQLLSCFLGSYTSQHSLLAKAQAARTQRLAAVATNFGGSFAAHAAAKQIVERNACESCGGFGARCMDCPDWQPNASDSYIECPDRERPVYRTAASTRPNLNAPVSCVLPR